MRTFSDLEENKILFWRAKEEPFETGSGDLEDIPVFGQDERSNHTGNINEMSSDSYESQGSRENNRKRNKQTKMRSLKKRGELSINQEVRIRNVRCEAKNEKQQHGYKLHILASMIRDE